MLDGESVREYYNNGNGFLDGLYEKLSEELQKEGETRILTPSEYIENSERVRILRGIQLPYWNLKEKTYLTLRATPTCRGKRSPGNSENRAG